MMFMTFNYIERTPNFDASHWPKCMSGDASPQSSLVNLMPTLRQQHANILSEYTLTMQGLQWNPLRKMVDRIRKFQILNDDIFSSLIRHISPGDGTAMLDFGTQVEDLEPMNPDFMPKGCEVSLCDGCLFRRVLN